jgi:glycogen synthase
MKGNSHLSILMTTDTIGGVWSYCIELCSALKSYDVQFHLVTTGSKLQPWQRKQVSALNNVKVYETDYKLEWMPDPWADIEASGKFLLDLEEVIQPDLIHLNSFCYGCLPFTAPKIVVAHSDVYSWWIAVNDENPPKEWKPYFNKVKRGLNRADLVVAPSEAMMDCIKEIYAPHSDKMVIYNGRNNNIFFCSQKQSTIMTLGRVWDEAKNIQLVVEASKHVIYPIKIAGDRKFGGNTLTGTNFNLNFMGQLNTEQVAEELSTASIFVLPAKYEPFGFSALEAALSGCALVLGDIPSLREIWGDSAVYVDTNDSVALAETLNSLMVDKVRLAEYCSKSSARAQEYSTELFAEQYLEAYEHLLQPHHTLNQELV